MPRDRRSNVVAWIVALVAVLAILAMLGWARRDPGFDDRIPDPEDAADVPVVLLLDPSPS